MTNNYYIPMVKQCKHRRQMVNAHMGLRGPEKGARIVRFRHYLHPDLLGLANLRACCRPWTW